MAPPTPEDLTRGLGLITAPGERSALSVDGYHRAGVLVPLVLGEAGAELLFTRRTEEVETHKGQISFPGGMTDGADADIVQTALRETYEELGIGASLLSVRGILDDIVVPTGFVITPVVATLNGLPKLAPNPQEVAEAFTVPLAFFCDPANGRTELREHRGISREVWFYEREERTIWGATAMIVRALVEKMGLV